MALKTVDLRRLVDCDESEATVKITDEDGGVHWFKNMAERTTSKSKMYWSDLEKGKEWFAAIEVCSQSVTNDQYIQLVDWWFESAYGDDRYKIRLNERYGNINVGIEVDKAYNWLLDHPNERKTSINAFLQGWLNRASSRA